MTGCKFSAVSKKHNIKATWKKVTGASKYIVYVGEKSDGSDKKKVGTYKAKKTSCTIKKYGMADLEYDKYYYVFITPYTKVGKKQKASDVSVSSEPVMCFSWK